jgi:hypothetical protein
MKKITKKAIKGFVKEQLANNDQWMFRALEILYKGQTEDEKMSAITRHENGIGFNAFDSEILTSFAQQYQRRGSLSLKQMCLLGKKLPKYWQQIISVSDATKLEACYLKTL